MSLWRHRDFLKLWTGQTVSLLGSQVTLLALPLAAILLFHASPFQVGALFSIQFLPFLLLGLPVGAWVDRLRRKPILIAADIGRFIAIGSIPVAHMLGALHLAQLYVVALVQGAGTVFFDVAYGAYLPALVQRDRLVEGNAKLELSRSGAQLAGPGLGGILVQAFSAAGAMAADALSYLVSVVSLLAIRTPEPAPPPADEDSKRLGGQVMDGLRYVRSQRLIRPLLACTAILNFFGIMLEAVLLVFAVRRLGLTAGEIGLIFTLGTVGFVAGAVVAERVGRLLGPGPGSLVGPGHRHEPRDRVGCHSTGVVARRSPWNDDRTSHHALVGRRRRFARLRAATAVPPPTSQADARLPRAPSGRSPGVWSRSGWPRGRPAGSRGLSGSEPWRRHIEQSDEQTDPSRSRPASGT